MQRLENGSVFVVDGIEGTERASVSDYVLNCTDPHIGGISLAQCPLHS